MKELIPQMSFYLMFQQKLFYQKKTTFLSKKALDISCKAAIGCLLSFVLKTIKDVIISRILNFP